MKQVVAVLIALAVTFSLSACTPKPPSAGPVVEKFLGAIREHDSATAASLLDHPEGAQDTIDKSWDGLQADRLETSNVRVNENRDQATTHYTMSWKLPKGRELTYDDEFTMSRTGNSWSIRWQPSVLQPQLGAHQHLELRGLPADRASVLGSDGAELLKPGFTYRLLVDINKVTDKQQTADAIAAAVGKDGPSASDIAEALDGAHGKYSVTVIADADAGRVRDALKDHPEVLFNKEDALVPTEPGFAPDVMPRVTQQVSDKLDGAAGWKVVIANEWGGELQDVEKTDPKPAPSVSVSLNKKVQKAADDALKSAPAGKQAMIVAIQPSTGAILAVAQNAEADKKGSLGLSGQYPPGSGFKIVTAAAGAQHQGLTPDSTVSCPGTLNLYGRAVTNYNGFSLGDVPLSKAFAKSCNTTFADVSTKLQPGELSDTAKQFGLGLDYDIPGLTTLTGSVPRGDEPLERTESGYGQGADLASPFGMAMVAATVAAGRTPTPYLIKGEETKANHQVLGVAPGVLDTVRTMMRKVVTEGTARGVAGAGEVYGKTGEAEVNDGSHAWFDGYRGDLAFSTLVVYGGGSEISVELTNKFLQNLDH